MIFKIITLSISLIMIITTPIFYNTNISLMTSRYSLENIIENSNMEIQKIKNFLLLKEKKLKEFDEFIIKIEKSNNELEKLKLDFYINQNIKLEKLKSEFDNILNIFKSTNEQKLICPYIPQL